MKVLIIDNYDSFTYNLYQYTGEILEEKKKDFNLDVVRNDELTLEEIKKRNYDFFIISPGPGHPADREYFGVNEKVITDIGKTKPVLGVCLGLQGIVHYLGGKIVRASLPMHGKISNIIHDGKGVFFNLPNPVEVMRYHSLIAQPDSIPDCLLVSAKVEGDGEIMGVRHKTLPIEGIQFHPESFGTEGGKKMIENFLFHNPFV